MSVCSRTLLRPLCVWTGAFILSLSVAVIGSLVALLDYRDVIMAVRESCCVNSQSVVRQSTVLL